MKHGLPQGLYVNKILNLPLKAYMQLYTDDILLIYTARYVTVLYDHATSNLAKIYDNLPSFTIIKSKYNSSWSCHSGIDRSLFLHWHPDCVNP